MKRLREILNERWAAYTFAACSAVILYLLLGHIGNIGGVFAKIYKLISPILGGVVIAYLMDPLVSLVERFLHRWIINRITCHGVAVALTAALIVVIFTLLIIALVPSLIDSVMTFLSNINSYYRTAEKFMRHINQVASENNLDISGITDYGQELLDSILNFLPSSINTIMTTSHNMGARIINLIISYILAIYFLNGKERIIRGIERLRQAMYNEETYITRSKFLKRCNQIIVSFVLYDLVDALIVGVANALFMMIMGMNYIPLISVIVGVMNLIPTFGPIVGAVIGGLIILLNNPVHALWFIIFTFILQTIDGYIVKPKLFGGSMGVSGVAILIMIIVGGNLLGPIGILLAIPSTAIFAFAYDELILPWIRRRRLQYENAVHPDRKNHKDHTEADADVHSGTEYENAREDDGKVHFKPENPAYSRNDNEMQHMTEPDTVPGTGDNVQYKAAGKHEVHCVRGEAAHEEKPAL